MKTATLRLYRGDESFEETANRSADAGIGAAVAAPRVLPFPRRTARADGDRTAPDRRLDGETGAVTLRIDAGHARSDANADRSLGEHSLAAHSPDVLPLAAILSPPRLRDGSSPAADLPDGAVAGRIGGWVSSPTGVSVDGPLEPGQGAARQPHLQNLRRRRRRTGAAERRRDRRRRRTGPRQRHVGRLPLPPLRTGMAGRLTDSDPRSPRRPPPADFPATRTPPASGSLRAQKGADRVSTDGSPRRRMMAARGGEAVRICLNPCVPAPPSRPDGGESGGSAKMKRFDPPLLSAPKTHERLLPHPDRIPAGHRSLEPVTGEWRGWGLTP